MRWSSPRTARSSRRALQARAAQHRRLLREALLHLGPLQEPLTIKGVTIGVPICEDIWHPEVCAHLVDQGARILLCPNGSPYWKDKQRTRYELVRARVREDNVPMLYLNQVGGQDELVYDGASFAHRAGQQAGVPGQARSSRTSSSRDWARTEDGWRCTEGEVVPLPSAEEAPWQACVLGLRDYVRKNGFKHVVLGLSGGIDSAVVAAMAADALGAENVHCLMLPYRYTSEESIRDAKDCAERLGVRYDVVSIGTPVDAVNARAGGRSSPAAPHDITEENIQSRMRGADADGGLQQARLAAAHHRQQVGDGGRLRDDLRRHERRLQPDQGHAQDAGLRAGRVAQRQRAGRQRSGRAAR